MPRLELEQYETPAPLVVALADRLPHLLKTTVFEPCAGDLAIARFFPNVFTNDIDPKCKTDTHLDMTLRDDWFFKGIPALDWVITNPPFSLAEAILPLAWTYCESGMAMLLRLSYQEPTKGRARWLKGHKKFLSNMIIFNPRPIFRLTDEGKKATDSVTVAWMVWRRHRELYGWTQVDYVTGWDPERRKK